MSSSGEIILQHNILMSTMQLLPPAVGISLSEKLLMMITGMRVSQLLNLFPFSFFVHYTFWNLDDFFLYLVDKINEKLEIATAYMCHWHVRLLIEWFLSPKEDSKHVIPFLSCIWDFVFWNYLQNPESHQYPNLITLITAFLAFMVVYVSSLF